MAKEMMIDIDGCICEAVDLSNLQAVADAAPIPGALERVREWVDDGFRICIFTTRPDSLAEVTEQWLSRHAVPYDRIIYNKPAADEYHYIDAQTVRATRFAGHYTEFVRAKREILVFADPDDRYRRRILIADSIAAEAIDYLRSVPDVEVEVATKLTPDELRARIPEFGALIVRSATKVTADIIAAGRNLRVIGRAGSGLDNIDTEAAADRGIQVLNVPKGLSVSVAELTMGLMLALARFIPQGTASLKAGRWEKTKFVGCELYKQTLGIIGLGGIGKMVAARGSSFGMNVVSYDAAQHTESLEEVIRSADFLTVHVPLTSETCHMISDPQFEMMKDGVRIINAARGGVIDEDALLRALDSGKVAAAALDVFEQEPPGDHPLLQRDNVIATPHIGASTVQAQINVGVTLAKQVVSLLLERTEI